jgi:lactoylglutathione lyase
MKIEHVAIWVSDLEQMRAFYEKYFQAKSNELYHNQKRGFRSYFLQFESGARLELMNISVLSPNSNSFANPAMGLAHLAFSVGSKESVDQLTDRIKSDGYEVVSNPRTTGDGYYESAVLDPENNIIELTV